MQLWKTKKWGLLFKSIIWLILVSFTSETLGLQTTAYAQDYLHSLPAPGTKVKLSNAHVPVLIKGIKTYADNPFRFDFFIDPGSDQLDRGKVEKESQKLIKYFLAALTVPENEMWVNLAPNEQDRITPAGFGVTEMGRDLLAQDYLLKQISASLLDPTTKNGEMFWRKIYADAKLDASQVSSLNKVWIVPDQAEVYTKGESAFVVNSRLKVLMQEDYFSLTGQSAARDRAQAGSKDIFAKTILPIIEKDVNAGENFELLRQIYQSMVLATWFKRHLRETVFGRAYVGQNKVDGVDIENKNIKEEIYRQYLAAFKKGVFDFIQEDYNEATDEVIPRKYFAGGVDFTHFGGLGTMAYRETSNPSIWNQNVLSAVPFKGQDFYRVSTVVVNPTGVDWYSRMQTAQSLAQGEWQVAASPIKSSDTRSSSVPVTQRIHRFFKEPSKWKSIAALAFSSIAILAAAGYSSDANGANFIYNGKQGMVIQVEKGDTLGKIALEMRQEQDRMRKAGITLEPAKKLWGPQGSVEVVAKAMGISDINQTLYPQDTFVIPTGLTSTDAQAALMGARVVVDARQAAIQPTNVRYQPQSAPVVYHFNDPMLRGENLRSARADGFEFTEEAEYQNRSYQVNPIIPLSLGALLFTGMGLAARQYLVQRSMGTQESSGQTPEPPHKPTSGEQRIIESLQKPVRFETTKPQSSSAELLSRHMTALSLPYIYARERMREHIVQLVNRLSANVVTGFNVDGQKDIDVVTTFNQSLVNILYSAWEVYFNPAEIETLITLKANELTEAWSLSDDSEFNQQAELDDFVYNELNPIVERKLSASQERLNSLLDDNYLALVTSALEAARQWQSAEAPGKVNTSDLVAKVISEITSDVKNIFGVEFEVRDVEADNAKINGTITVDKVKAAFQLNSLEYLALVARFHQAGIDNARELMEPLVALLVDRLKINTAQAQDAISRYLEPILARYWDTAFYREYNAKTIEALMQANAEKLVRQAKEQSLNEEEINRQIQVVIQTQINPAIVSELARTVGRVHQEYFTEDVKMLFSAAMTTSVEMQSALANGASLDMNQVVGHITQRLGELFYEQFQLVPMPVLVQGATIEASAQANLQTLSNGPGAEVNSNQINDRSSSRSFALADITILCTTAIMMLATGNTDSQGLLTTLASPFMFRAGLTGSLWLHELSHMLAGGRKAITSANWLANIPMRDWFSMMLPLNGKVATDLHIKVPEVKRIHAWVIRAFGIISSIGLALGAILGVRHLVGDGNETALMAVMPLVTSTILVAFAAIKSDFLDPLRGKDCKDEFNCGVAIVLTKRQPQDKGITGERVRKIFQRMGRVTDIRGQQAAGSRSLAINKKGQHTWVGHRMVNSKRGDLPDKLNAAYRAKTNLKSLEGYQGSDVSMIFGHYRFGTSSAPKASETHPHQWLPDRPVKRWVVKDGLVVEEDAILGLTIVHNGDFDDWLMNGQYQTNGDISYWLSNVLHQPDVTDGDSPKIAGMMDYLVTKGIWEASVRYGYYETIAKDFADVFGGKFEKVIEKITEDGTPIYKVVSSNTAITNEQIEQISARLREVFLREAMGLLGDQDTDLVDFLPRDPKDSQYKERKLKLDKLKESMVSNLSGNPLTLKWSTEQRQRFVDVTVEAFLQNDEYRAAQIFIDRAKGSFGLGIGSTFKPDGVVLVADGQPLALGFDEERSHLLIASEPSALKVPINPDGDKTLDYRLSLRQNPGKGEIVNIHEGTKMTIFSRELGRELTEQEIQGRVVSLHRNPYITSLPELERDDPVGDDIKDTAVTLEKIKGSWADDQSFNRQTEKNIFRLLMRKYLANQMMKLSVEYSAINPGLHARSREMTTALGVRLIGELNDSIGPDRNWATRLDLPSALTGFTDYIDGAFDLVFDRKYIKDQILAEADAISELVMLGGISEKAVKGRIEEYIQNQLKVIVAQEKQRAQHEVEQLLERWVGVIKAEVVLQVRKSALSKAAQPENLISHLAFEKIQERWKASGIQSGFRRESKAPDVVVSGIEISQWMGEQFAEDLKRVFPELEIKAISSNKILADPFIEGIDDQTIVLAISQSGQTFPTLNATILLENLSPGRVFVLTGEWDTLMGQAVGQEYQPDSPFSGRIISNYSGFRPAEAVSLTGTATHATLTELMVSLGRDFSSLLPTSQPLGLSLSSEDIQELNQKRDELIKDVEMITAVNRGGQPVTSSENKAIELQAKKWARHVLDAPLSKVLTTIHLFVSVVGGFLLFPFLAQWFGLGIALPIVALAQYFFFEFFQYTTVVTMRLIQGRVPLARVGKRTIVIGDRPYIHQALEMFLTKMNSLSKSATAVDVHGGNPNDHFVHRFGHRVVRGSLLLLGVPDGRLNEKLNQMQSNVAMTGKQAKGVRNFGVGAEVITIGKPRAFNKNAADINLTIPGDVKPVNENMAMLLEDRFDSLSRLVVGQVFLHSMQRRVSTLGMAPAGRWLWPWSWKIHRTQSGPRIATTASPTSAASLTREFKKGPQPLPLGLRPRSGYVPVEVPDADKVKQASSAATDVGGIDLNPQTLDLKESGRGVVPSLPAPFVIDPTMIRTMPNDQFVPMIIEVVPVKNVDMFLGMADRPQALSVVSQ